MGGAKKMHSYATIRMRLRIDTRFFQPCTCSVIYAYLQGCLLLVQEEHNIVKVKMTGGVRVVWNDKKRKHESGIVGGRTVKGGFRKLKIHRTARRQPPMTEGVGE
ncbi:hypothetical protein ES707_20501 [subsurface metagenome]